MEHLLPEIVSYIFRFLSVSDRKEASLVCRKWYFASLDPCLQKDLTFKCHLTEGTAPVSTILYGRKLTRISFGNEHSSIVSEEYLSNTLLNTVGLQYLDLSFCNSLFLSGRLWSDTAKFERIREKLKSVTELKLSCLRHMTDVTFSKIVSATINVEKVNLASNNILFNSLDFSSSSPHPAVLNFSSILRFTTERATCLKELDFSFTAMNDQAIDKLCSTPGLALESLVLVGCQELTDKGVKAIAQTQPGMLVLDISKCKSVATSKSFFRVIVNNMPRLHTFKAQKCPQIGQCDIDSLSILASLQSFDIGEALNLFENDLIKGLCRPQRSLTTVNLAYCSGVSDRFVLALCESNSSLQALDLTACRKITDASVRAITKHLHGLQSLCLAYCHDISDLGLLGYISEEQPLHRHLFEHDHETCSCMRVRESRIFSPPKGIREQHQSSLTKLQHQLESGEDSLYKISNLVSLKSLDLSSCPKITDLGIIEAVKFSLLQNLWLEYLPKLSDEGVANLVRNNPSLECISLRGCGDLSDVAIHSVSTHCPCLKSLNVAQMDKLTDTVVDYFTHRCKRLRHLDVSFCGNVTCDAVMRLDKLCPNVKVHFRPHIF